MRSFDFQSILFFLRVMVRSTIMAAAAYPQSPSKDIFLGSGRSLRSRWRIGNGMTVRHNIRCRRKCRHYPLQWGSAFLTFGDGRVRHVPPKGEPFGTKQRLQTIGSLVFINGHTVSPYQSIINASKALLAGELPSNLTIRVSPKNHRGTARIKANEYSQAACS